MIDERLPGLEWLAPVARAARSLELEPFLQTVIAAASELTSSEAAAILEFDERSKSLRFLAVPPAYQDARHNPPIPLEKSAAGEVIRRCEPLQIQDDEADQGALAGTELQLASKTHSLLAVPLMLTGRALGVLEAINKNDAHYTEDDVTILEMLAAVAASAIDRDRLRQRIEASLAELSELDRLKSDFIAITSHELRTPLGVILGHATYLRELVEP
jgi:GAF domain-containing protein